MSSSVDLPSIQTNFPSYSTPARPFHTNPSPSSPSPAMRFQNRSYSTPSLPSLPSLSSRLSSSSLHSQYSSSSDRSMSCSPGPSTPCDFMSRSPSFSHDRPSKPLTPKFHLPPFSSVLPQPKGYSIQSSHHSYQPSYQTTHSFTSVSHPATALRSQQQQQQQYHGQAMSSPRDTYPSASRDHADYHREPLYHARGDRSSYSGSGDYFSRPTSLSSYHHHPPTPTTPTTPTPMETKLRCFSPTPLAPLQIPSAFSGPTPATASARMMMMMDEEHKHPLSPSPSVMSDRVPFSPELSPFPLSEKSYMGLNHCGGMASPSPTSLSASLSSYNCSTASLASSGSMTPGPSNPQLLLCPVCNRAFKPSKNQNCNLRRHLKNVHNMSPTMHPRKCKWDSLPDGRVKDDKDRKERTRKSKRLWARKFRLRRKVEEAAVVLSMLSQAI
ncbi:hypothetical protein BGZ65_001644 [Modicella reniformis]|uniref:Uncharacterized protein n=1 Tax=Modicella reniformis TaxID=1440133 RepID=A0A9P6ML89_9FUNG|nr:hypothetical protein BGZ65_001644 [Modicella reniformis]